MAAAAVGQLHNLGSFWELYTKSEDYAIKKPKYTDQKGNKREYCNLGWSKEFNS